MHNWVQAQGRVLSSAQALKVYFERKLKARVEILGEAPQVLDQERDIRLLTALTHYGLWGVRVNRGLNDHEADDLRETFNTILGAMHKLHVEHDDYNLLAHVHAVPEAPSNVIPFRLRRDFDIVEEEPQKKWTLKYDCLIEAPFFIEIQKMAVELHSHSSRYAMLEYRDLDPLKRVHIPELLAMGAISLFVTDILELSAQEQSILHRLTEIATENRPLLMVGTTLPYGDLRSTPNVNVEFLASLSRAYIKLSRPFSEYKDQGLIRYFLDSLSSSPT